MFCAVCGSQVMSQASPDSAVVSVRKGFVEGDPGVRPSFRQFTDAHPAREPIPDDGLPRHPGPRPT